MRTMKRMIFSLLFVVGFSSAIMAQKYDVNWEKMYGKAVETARKHNKPILRTIVNL